MDIEKRITEIIKSFSEVGIQLERSATTYSFGTREECEELFYTSLTMCDRTMSKIEKLPEYNEIIDWMVDTKGKGLFLAGSCGRGKTSILTGVVPVIFKLRFNKVLKPISANEMTYKGDFMRSWAFCIDDVGIEPLNNNYGEKREIFADVMNIAESKLLPVFASTNLSGEVVIKRYGNRTMDRIIRLCKIVVFKGSSLR